MKRQKNKTSFLVLDVDGTLTNGKVYLTNCGDEIKAFDIKDGCGIKDILPVHGIIPVVITARSSNLLEKRCDELGVKELHQGCRDKLSKLYEILAGYEKGTDIGLNNVIYMGDDILDYEVMKKVKDEGGITVCPIDAIERIKDIADYICINKGGDGAVREFIDWYTGGVNYLNDEDVQRVPAEVLDYIDNFDFLRAGDGRFQLGNGVIAQVMSYITRPFGSTVYESHRRYVDIQFIVYGRELMLTENVNVLQDSIIKEYDDEKDIVLYSYSGGKLDILKPGSLRILTTEDAHRGAIAVDEPIWIKKVVFKVPIDRMKF